MEDEIKQIILLKEGSHKAFQWIYNYYWSQVYNFTRLYITSIEESKEIVQEVFIKLWETKHRINENNNIKGFLFIVTRNTIFNIKRNNLNEEYYKMSVLKAYSENDTTNYSEVEEEIYASELKDYIDLLIDALPEKQKKIFILSRKENLTNKEIAEKMNLNIKTVEAYITKSLKYLKENIDLFAIFIIC